MRPFIIQSHRGAGVLAAENTIAAFQLAWELGTVPEADVRTTQDGVLVAFHDQNFARVVQDVAPELRDEGVEDVTFAALEHMEVGAWQDERWVGHRVPRIAEIFELMRQRPERSLYLDVKNVYLPQLAALVEAYGVAHQVIVASPNHATLREWKSLVPASQTLLWMGGEEVVLRQRLEALRETGFDAVTQLQIHVHVQPQPEAPMAFMPSAAFLSEVGRELRRHNIVFQTLPWRTTEPTVYVALLNLGVQSFATDSPDITLRVVREYLRTHHPS